MVELSVKSSGVTERMLPRKIQEGEMRLFGQQGPVSLGIGIPEPLVEVEL